MSELGGCGIDVVEIARIDRLLRTYGSSFAERWFADSEVTAYSGGPHPEERFAACLAAKEAVVKALGMDGRGPVPWRQVEVLGLAAGCPDVRLRGAAAATANRRGVGSILVTVSVGGGIATAVAIASVGDPTG